MAGMPAEHAILGLLALSKSGSGHGYDLARQFGPNAPLSNVLRLEPGMVYHHLKKLQRLGWVSVVPGGGQGRPACKLFALSATGQAELERWLSEPVSHTREIRIDFLVKLYLALLHDPQLALRLVDEQLERCLLHIDSLAKRLQTVSEAREGESAPQFGEMVLDMRLAQTRAAVTWLDQVRRDATAAAESANAKHAENRDTPSAGL